jgi:hypothetical protein
MSVVAWMFHVLATIIDTPSTIGRKRTILTLTLFSSTETATLFATKSQKPTNKRGEGGGSAYFVGPSGLK